MSVSIHGWRSLAQVAACISFAFPVYAHHSARAIFDRSDPIEVTGTVTSVEWMNPHIWFFVDVEEAGSDVVNWGFEMSSPNDLMREGWNHNSLQIGDVITVVGGARAERRADRLSAKRVARRRRAFHTARTVELASRREWSQLWHRGDDATSDRNT